MLSVGTVILGGLSVGYGVLSGIASYNATDNQIKAQNEQIDFQQKQLERQQNYLKQQYDNSVKWTKYQFGQSMNQGNLSISQATQNRDLTAITNADAIKLQNKQEELQLQNTVAQYTAQNGQINSSIASSGLRRSEGTTQDKAADIQQQYTSSAVKTAFESYELSSRQRYMNARMSYIQSGRDIDSYREQLAMIQAQTQYSLMTQKQQYEYNDKEITEQIANLENQKITGWEADAIKWMNALTGGVQGTASFASASNATMALFDKTTADLLSK